MAAYTGNEGNTSFGVVCVEVTTSGTIDTELVVTLGTTTDTAGIKLF